MMACTSRGPSRVLPASLRCLHCPGAAPPAASLPVARITTLYPLLLLFLFCLLLSSLLFSCLFSCLFFSFFSLLFSCFLLPACLACLPFRLS
jgi:hypothetical protein